MPRLTARTISSVADVRAVVHDLEVALQTGPVTLATIPGADLTPAQAGAVLGVSRQFIDRLIAQGRLRCQRLPGSSHRRIPADEVSRFAETRDESRAAHAPAVAALDAAQVPWE